MSKKEKCYNYFFYKKDLIKIKLSYFYFNSLLKRIYFFTLMFVMQVNK